MKYVVALSMSNRGTNVISRALYPESARCMNDKKVKKILEIMVNAHGECGFCAADLFEIFVEEFPEYKDIALEIYKNKFGCSMEEFREHDHWADLKKGLFSKHA